eukprot:GFKZ01010914.1.p1 GENE.GFKZ01010914.1~~GFKZ01010914.1.p1  ORF type:complete len:165 (+),score=17.58 GFKZ01010914.1:93-587(+)
MKIALIIAVYVLISCMCLSGIALGAAIQLSPDIHSKHSATVPVHVNQGRSMSLLNSKSAVVRRVVGDDAVEPENNNIESHENLKKDVMLMGTNTRASTRSVSPSQHRFKRVSWQRLPPRELKKIIKATSGVLNYVLDQLRPHVRHLDDRVKAIEEREGALDTRE